MSDSPETALWQEVLLRQISDAVNGPSGVELKNRVHVIEQARLYLTEANPAFEEVCILAGLDPDATRERMRVRIADAPTPEAMIGKPNKYASRIKAPRTNKPRSKTIKIMHNGKERTLTELSESHSVNRQTLRKRIEAGWPTNLALSVAPMRGGTRPGVVSNFGASSGTGGGRFAQATPNITFSKRKAKTCL